MNKSIYLYTLVIVIFMSCYTYAQKTDKFSQEITIDCEDIPSAKMSSNETIYGSAKEIDITFPFKTRIDPKKGAEIKLKAPGYDEYKLIVPPGGFESYYMVSFTANAKEMAKLNKSKDTPKVDTYKEANQKVNIKGQTMDITIDCTQFESAKMTSPTSVGKLLLFGAIGAVVDQQKKLRDVTFPFTTTIEIDKEYKFIFIVPGYNPYELVIPKGNTESNFKLYFTENAKQMAKIRKQSSESNNKASTKKQIETTPVSRDTPGQSAPEQNIIRWMVDSDPQGARIFYRIISSIPAEVKNTNESYLLTTPYEETRSFNILGLTYENSRNVQVEIKLMKPGYHTQVKRFNIRQALDQQEISAFFTLVKKEEEVNESVKKETTVE